MEDNDISDIWKSYIDEISEYISDISLSSITYSTHHCLWTIFQIIGLNMFPSDLCKNRVIIYNIYSAAPPFGTSWTCGVWWRGLTTNLLYIISQIRGDLILNNSLFIHFT